MNGVKIVRQVVVFDASDIAAESAFWAGMLGGIVLANSSFHCVFDADGHWVIGVQLAPNHQPPNWPDGNPQQVHLDLHVDDFGEAHARAMKLGARTLKVADDVSAVAGHQVYADPAGHPFCIGWGHPNDEDVRKAILQNRN
jgi:hypothetical protein